MSITPLTVTIDLNPSYKKIPAVYVSQLDNNLRELAITVQDGGVNYDVASSGYDVYVEGTKPDKHGFSYKVTDIGGTVVGSVVTVPMQTQMTCVQGMVPTEIVLKSGSDRIGSANFLLVVERAGLAEDVDVSETDIPAYIDGAQQAAAAAAQSADDAEDAKDLAVSAAATAQDVLDSIPQDYSDLSNDVDDLKSAMSDVIGYDLTYTYTIVKNEYVTTNGVITPYDTWDRTDYIELKGTKLMVSQGGSGNPYNCFYDADKVFISNFQTKTGETATIDIPSNAKYVILSAGAGVNWVLTADMPNSLNDLDSRVTALEDNITAWSGKKWVSYGDSVTQGNKWQPYVVEKFGLIHTNAGVGGSSVADGQINGVVSMCDADRILALPSDADLITVMGGTNDYNLTNSGNGTPLGSFPTTSGAYDTYTFYGAYLAMIQRIQARCPNALIIIMSCINSRGTSGQPADYCYVNNVGLTTPDYAKAAEEVARYTGCSFVDMEKCGINLYNRAQYISDAVHPNDAGGELMARMLIGYLADHYPLL